MSRPRHTCTKDHVGQVPGKIGNLPESQAGPWRHRCAACAYQMGLEDGLKADLRTSKGKELILMARNKVHAHA